MENLNEFAAELAQELAEENIISECALCNGSGVIRTEDDWGEQAEECVCLKKYHGYF